LITGGGSGRMGGGVASCAPAGIAKSGTIAAAAAANLRLILAIFSPVTVKMPSWEQASSIAVPAVNQAGARRKCQKLGEINGTADQAGIESNPGGTVIVP
jgi:hypothetical protein